MLDTLHYDNNNTVSFSFFVTPNSMDVGANIRYVRLKYIDQDKINILVDEGLLGIFHKT